MAKKHKKNRPGTAEKIETRGAGQHEKTFSGVPSGTNLKFFVFGALAIFCLVIYGQTLGFDFVNLDDDIYVYENSFVSRGLNFSNLKWALTSFHASNWHPLTWISHQLDAQLFGPDAAGHHFVNVIFHITNSILVFVVVKRLTNAFWKSALVAALFAVHPAHVESVAWISERKDVLSTLFWLLTMWAYLRFADSRAESSELRVESRESRVENKNQEQTTNNEELAESENKKELSTLNSRLSTPDSRLPTKFYLLAVVFFALGLMSKPMLVTLPFVLLLCDFWPLERFERWNLRNLWPLVKEKIPFFGLSAVSAVMTIFAQGSGGAIQSTETISLADRLLNTVVSYAKYVVMLFYPVNLGAWYPFDNHFSAVQIAASLVLLLGITALAIWQINRRKYLFVGWCWFLGTLVPVIGILQVGRQALADRYTYIPYIGLSIALIWLAGEIFERFKLNKPVAVAAICGISLAALGILSFFQTSYWKTSETIALRTLEVTRNNYFIENNYCNYLGKKNRLAEAEAQCRAAIEHQPKLAEAYNTLGTVQLKQNKYEEARKNFEKTIELNPNYALAFANLAIIETRENNLDAAGENLKKAIAADKGGFFDASRLVDAYANLAVASMQQKRYDKSAEFFQKALDIAPNNPDFQRNLALSLHMQGKSAEAVKILEDATRKNPNLPEVYNTLGLIYAEQNRKQEAIAQFQKALQINPNFTPAQANLRKAME